MRANGAAHGSERRSTTHWFATRNVRVDVIALHDALDQMGSVDARMARIVELRFFAGLTEDETASVMKVSGSTVRREWRMARNWLYHALCEGDEVDAPVLD